jgi:hypothetical protein
MNETNRLSLAEAANISNDFLEYFSTKIQDDTEENNSQMR